MAKPTPEQRFEDFLTVVGQLEPTSQPSVLTAVADLIDSVLYHYGPPETEKAPDPRNAILVRELEIVVNRARAKAHVSAVPEAPKPNATEKTDRPTTVGGKHER